MYRVVSMRPPDAPQISVQFASSDSIRISWDQAPVDDGGTPIQGFVLHRRTGNVVGPGAADWARVELTAETKAHTMVGLRCGTQYVLKMSAINGVGEGQSSEEFNVWTKGKSEYAVHSLVSYAEGCFLIATPVLHAFEQSQLNQTKMT